ncbi:Polysaccharide pyruvyl transferase [Reichenbachiella faecimaris]|uniref:Polysaccharide pyruvyl transferase n=1 Tax=Reichenbachiella faecimaris TaxID=692418 RepID=A0A1W2GN19_REIFA|nr:polysaccharide pyruvyl transferase family protein [Reichenbachiella faecimaris]SMD37738.1 Polysaccharide pyruvyl transferase [Reichenbachiella faecimaris]
MAEAIVAYYKSRNIGDEVQTIAAKKLLNKENILILDRENLDSHDSEEDIKLLCNGWFMHEPNNWPPKDNINPYFISFHIAKFKEVRKAMLADAVIPYYKKFEPIGCRDYNTMRLFQAAGVDAYYSGCLTLTLPKYEGERNNNIIISDLFYDNILKEGYANKVIHKLVPKKYHERLQFVTHTRENTDLSIEEKMQEAQQLLDTYAKAELVITSRIHCALPCLAMGTPVLFFDFGYANKIDKYRFEGIIDFFNTVRPNLPFHENRKIDKFFKFFGLHRLFFPFIKPLNIDWENPPKNKDNHIPIAEEIRKKVTQAFS